jgi:NAD(P)H dehydrogenase (quinone)
VAIASFEDADALSTAFRGTEGVFVMIAPNFAPQPGYPNAHAAAAVLKEALTQARPARIAALSSIGGQRESGLGLITQVHILEDALASLSTSIPTAILRPAWFMENSLWDIAPSRDTGVMPSFLQPLDRKYSMVATRDIGCVIANTLTQTWHGRRVIEIEGPQRYTQHEIAALLGETLGRAVRAEPVPREQWEALFQTQGTTWPAPRIEMIDGFNSGWIDFEEDGVNERVVGETGFGAVLRELVERGIA